MELDFSVILTGNRHRQVTRVSPARNVKMSQHAVSIVAVCGALLLGAAGWMSFSNNAPQDAEPVIEVSEENSDLLFAESLEDELEDDVEVTVESEFDGNEEVDAENRPDDGEQ